MIKTIIYTNLFFALFVVSASNSFGGEISKTNFSDGDTFSSGPLNGQGVWNAKGKAEISINDNDEPIGVTLYGFENIVNSESNSEATVKPGTTYTSSIVFTYSDNSKGEDKNGPHVGAAIFAGPSPSDEQIRINLSRSGKSFRFNLAKNFGNEYPDFDDDGSGQFNQSPVVDNTELGFDFDSGDSESDVLRLSFSLTATDEPGQWTAEGVLVNETSGEEVLSWVPHIDGDETFSFGADVGSVVYGGFGGGQSDDNQIIENRTITEHAFSVSADE